MIWFLFLLTFNLGYSQEDAFEADEPHGDEPSISVPAPVPTAQPITDSKQKKRGRSREFEGTRALERNEFVEDSVIRSQYINPSTGMPYEVDPD